MKTENFSLIGAGAVFMRQGIIRVLRYDEGDAGGPVPLIRVTSMSGSDVDVEMKPGRIINLKEPINGLVIRNLSGAKLTGKFTWGDGSVEDNAFSGVFDLTAATINALINSKYNTRPEIATGNWASAANAVLNTPMAVFTPASNANGVLLLSAYAVDNLTGPQSFIASTVAPTNFVDGEVVALSAAQIATGNTQNISLEQSVLIPAGKGLYFISSGNGGSGYARCARWRDL